MNIALETSFEDILPSWQILWPNRISAISAMSSMTLDGKYDLSIYQAYAPTFFCVTHDQAVVGVISGHRTSRNEYRSRGLWVAESKRGNGIGKILLHAVISQAITEKCTIVWTLPRQSSLYVYKQAGFDQVGPFFNEAVEFGPNCYAVLGL